VLVRGLSSAPLPSLLNLQIELRKCCNHPFLIRGVEQSVIATDCMLIATDCY
jgi:chromodomain-helicase-DNA-binding protein 7